MLYTAGLEAENAELKNSCAVSAVSTARISHGQTSTRKMRRD